MAKAPENVMEFFNLTPAQVKDLAGKVDAIMEEYEKAGVLKLPEFLSRVTALTTTEKETAFCMYAAGYLLGFADGNKKP